MIFSFPPNKACILTLGFFLFPGYLFAESLSLQATYYADAFE